MKLKLLAATAIVGSLVAGTADACICPRPDSASKGRDASAAVFEGHVVAIRKSRRSLGKFGRLDDHRIKVHRVWKGRVGRTAIVVSSKYATCGLSLPIGIDFLIYAEEEHGILFTHICTRTGPTMAESAQEDVVNLGKPIRTYSPPCEDVAQSRDRETHPQKGAVQHGVERDGR
jgi:hypothetical protein